MVVYGLDLASRRFHSDYYELPPSYSADGLGWIPMRAVGAV